MSDAIGLPDLVARLRLLFDDKDIEKSAKKATATVKSSFSKIQDAAKPVGLAVAGIGAGLTALSLPAERAHRTLKRVIENTGASYDQFAGKIDKAIDKQARFGHNSTEVQTALSTLELKLKDPQKALDALATASDVAALKQISLAQATALVAGAMTGNKRSLKQFGIELDTTIPKAEAVDKAVAQLRRTTAGFAQQEANTVQGRLEGLKTTLQNLGAEIGTKAGPALAGLGAGLTAVGGAAQGVDALGNILEKLPTKVASVSSSLGILGATVGAGFVLGAGFLALEDAIDHLVRGTPDIEHTAAALLDATKNAGKLGDALKTGRVNKGDVKDALDQFRQFSKDIGNQGQADAALTSLRHNLDDVDKGLATLVASNPKAAAAALKLVVDQLGLTPTEQKKIFEDYAGALQKTGDKAKFAAASIDDTKESTKQAADAASQAKTQYEGAARALQAMLDAQLGQVDSSLAAESATRHVADAAKDVVDKQKAVVAAQKAYDDAVKEHGKKSDEAKKAAEDLAQANTDAGDSILSQKQAAVDAARAAAQLAQDQANAAGQAFTLADRNQVTRDKLAELAKQIGGPVGAALSTLAGQIHDIDGAKEVLLTADTTQADAALARTLGLITQLNNALGMSKTGDLGFSLDDLSAALEGKAAGGPVQKNIAYIVGERGPELFVPDVNGRIMSRVPPTRRPGGADPGPDWHRAPDGSWYQGSDPVRINAAHDPNRGRSGFVQAEDGSWVPKSFYAQQSTNWNLNGVVVQANDPAQMQRQLEARARLAALAGG